MVGCKTRGSKRREINARSTKSRDHASNLEPELSTSHFLFFLHFLLENVRVMKPAGLAIPCVRRGDLRLTRRAFLEQLGAIIDAEGFFGLGWYGPRTTWANSV
jgi:hypothetical protein